ncbi:MAG: hypothetical protein PW788_02815 [Micavibrio sp.]|nr:hypothetical protein [Micavibrio sp.]
MIFHDFMAGWGWVILSLIAAVFLAGFYLVNQYLRQPGHILVFWVRVLVVIFLSPLISRLSLPTDWHFYAAVLLTVLVATFADIRTFNVSAKYGGGVVARVQPVTVWGAFLLWFLFDPQLITQYLSHPWNTAGILAALGGCVFFSMRLNKCQVTRAAMIEMAPALVGYTFTTVLNKYALSHATLESGVYSYMFVQSVFAAVIIGIYAMIRAKYYPVAGSTTGWVTKPMLAATLLATFTWICHMTYKNYAMAFTPNPSFQAALLLTAPVFISIFYHFARHKEEGDVKSGMGIVACALLLALMTVR